MLSWSRDLLFAIFLCVASSMSVWEASALVLRPSPPVLFLLLALDTEAFDPMAVTGDVVGVERARLLVATVSEITCFSLDSPESSPMSCVKKEPVF